MASVSTLYYTLGLVALVLISAGVFINNFNIVVDDDTSKFLDYSNQLSNELSNSSINIYEKTDESPLQDVPIFGKIYTAGKILFGIATTVKTSAMLLISFVDDSLTMLKINSEIVNIIKLLLIGMVVFIFARAIRG